MRKKIILFQFKLILGLFIFTGYLESSPWGNNTVRLGTPVNITAGEIIEGNLLALDCPVELYGEVQGNVIIIGGTLKLGRRANITKDLILVAKEFIREPGAIISGSTIDVCSPWIEYIFLVLRFIIHNFYIIIILFAVGLLALVVLVIRTFLLIKLDIALPFLRESTGAAFIYGLLTTLIFFTILGICTVSFFGIGLIAPVGFLYLFLVAAGYIIVAMHIGKVVALRIHLTTNTFLETIIGVLTLTVVSFIPLIGTMVEFVVGFTGLGAIVKSILNKPTIADV